jgi:hypothetical protein
MALSGHNTVIAALCEISLDGTLFDKDPTGCCGQLLLQSFIELLS